MQWANRSVEWKVPLWIGGLLLVLTVTFAVGAYLEVRSEAVDDAARRIQTVANDYADRLQNQSTLLNTQARTIAHDSGIRNFLDSRGARDSVVAARILAGLVRPGGSVVAAELRRRGRPILRVGTTDAALYSLVTEDPGTLSSDTAWVGDLAVFNDSLFLPTVAAAGHDDVLVIWRRLSGNPDAARTNRMIGEQGRVFIGSIHGAWTDQVRAVAPPPLAHAPTDRLVRFAYAGTPQLGWKRSVAGSHLLVTVRIPESTILASARRFLWRAAVATLLAVLAGGIGVALLARRLSRSFERITARMDQETRAHAAAEQEWQNLFDRVPLPMWVFANDSLRFLAVNEAAIQSYGYSREEFKALTVRDIRPASELPVLMETLATLGDRLTRPSPSVHRRKDGTVFDVEVTSHGIVFADTPGRIVIAQDVTARKALEAQLRQSQKMEAIGSLSAGIAHDFNNQLAVITTYSELVQATLDPEDERRRDLDLILQAAGQAHALTRQLLAFSRRQVLQPVVLEMNKVVAATGRLLERVLGEHIRLRLELKPDAGSIRIDPSQFEQVLMNLAVNARDAMEGGGTLTIGTGVVDLDDMSAAVHGLAEPGVYGVLSVTDTGTGISKDSLPHIFEPFYTTKEAGKGTGLGLATVFGIVKQSGGHISVYSEPGVGTTFRIYLARVEPEGPRQEPAHTEWSRGGNETILLVEDDPMVRAATSAILEHLGYRILIAASPDEALEVATPELQNVALMLSDVVMPGMNGLALYDRLRLARPGLRILLISGYAGDETTSRRIIAENLPFLAKPFLSSELASKLREVLDSA